ncbi:MAG: Glycosyltransferase, group 2 family [Parcubacteria group bacterium GW2011_GWA2_38_13]|nr:MAG: Glycosyltransferase, group 2 family [Parcubacteria group bacterium GW2011_GWA2_38_13]
MKIQKITVIVPCYNEIATIEKALQILFSVDFQREREVIIVDDGSTDGTREFLEKLSHAQPEFILLFHEKNYGKGAAIRTGLNKASGDYVIVHDADLEYNPHDIIRLIECAEKNNALVAFGSRNKDIKNTYLYPHFYWGSMLLTIIINVLFRQKTTDPETCYKLIERNLLCFIDIHEKGFGVEMETTLKIMKLKVPISEVSITYNPRGFKQGKKIKTKDGLWALYLIFWYFLHDMHFGPLDCFLRFIRIRAAQKYFQSFGLKNVLDVGCGRQGYIGWKFAESMKSYTGLDTNIIQCSIRNITFVKGDINNIAQIFLGKKFDTVVGLAVIEHIDDPIKFIKDCFSLLASGGEVILSTPSPYAHPILHILSRIGLINKNEIDCHEQYFSLMQAVSLLEENGFKIIYSKRFIFGLNSVVAGKKK